MCETRLTALSSILLDRLKSGSFVVSVFVPIFALALVASPPVSGEVIEATDTHYRLSLSATASSPPAELWNRLVHPERWWNPLHSYSGQAENLSLDARAGGLWREDWDGGSVAHGRVLLVREEQLLRMEALFGPLQGIGAYVVWTITITAEGDGSRVTFDEVATAAPGSKLDELAGAVDGVKEQAINLLTGT